MQYTEERIVCCTKFSTFLLNRHTAGFENCRRHSSCTQSVILVSLSSWLPVSLYESIQTPQSLTMIKVTWCVTVTDNKKNADQRCLMHACFSGLAQYVLYSGLELGKKKCPYGIFSISPPLIPFPFSLLPLLSFPISPPFPLSPFPVPRVPSPNAVWESRWVLVWVTAQLHSGWKITIPW